MYKKPKPKTPGITAKPTNPNAILKPLLFHPLLPRLRPPMHRHPRMHIHQILRPGHRPAAINIPTRRPHMAIHTRLARAPRIELHLAVGIVLCEREVAIVLFAEAAALGGARVGRAAALDAGGEGEAEDEDEEGDCGVDEGDCAGGSAELEA